MPARGTPINDRGAPGSPLHLERGRPLLRHARHEHAGLESNLLWNRLREVDRLEAEVAEGLVASMEIVEPPQLRLPEEPVRLCERLEEYAVAAGDARHLANHLGDRRPHLLERPARVRDVAGLVLQRHPPRVTSVEALPGQGRLLLRAQGLDLREL